MSTKKKIILISALVFTVLLIPIILVCFAFGLPAQYDESFYGGMKIKYDRLKSVKGKKIVVIGGSSVAFGLRSDIMEHELNMPVVNFGLYANLGTKFMLDIAEDYINDGDIVIIAPEQNSQSLSLYFNAEAVWYSSDGNFNVLWDIDFDNAGDMAKEFLTFVGGKFRYWQSNSKPNPSGVYNARSFDKYGDIKYLRECNVMQSGYDAGTPISFEKKVISIDFINYLNDYRARLVKKGANVLYSFCPMNAAALSEASTAEVQKQYYDYLTKSLTFSVIGNPESHLLDSEWFYDSNFHLNTAGAEYYTLLLAQELKSELGDFTPILTETPQKPVPPDDDNSAQGTISKDLTEAAKIFELSGVTVTTENGEVVLTGSWIINGLTEYGKTLTEIVIPDTLAGLPVVGLADACFKGNTVVTKITFGINMASVGEEVFTGCINLRGVYITSLDPNTYHPAITVFDGLKNCAFYVPKEVYASDYMVDYFWGRLDSDMLKSY